MKTQIPASAVFILPNAGPASTPTVADGYTGLNNLQRIAHAEMRHRAFSIWECKGRPDNSQLSDWLEAEAEVQAETQLA